MPIVCPFAEWRPLPEATSQPTITPRVVIFHTMVGGLAGTERHFRDNTGIESHFGVGGPTDGASLDGALWQWMDLGREADANLDANRFAISIETSDGGDPTRPWSPKQLAMLVRVGNWLADRFSIPRQQCPTWNGSGFGWHVMFGAPSHWTPVAKVCPGSVRIGQLKETVLPAIFAAQELGGLSVADANDIMVKLEAVYDALRDGGGNPSNNNNLSNIRGHVLAIEAAVGKLGDDEANILAAISGVTGAAGTLTDEQAAAAAAQIAAALSATLPTTVLDGLAARLQS